MARRSKPLQSPDKKDQIRHRPDHALPPARRLSTRTKFHHESQSFRFRTGPHRSRARARRHVVGSRPAPHRRLRRRWRRRLEPGDCSAGPRADAGSRTCSGARARADQRHHLCGPAGRGADGRADGRADRAAGRSSDRQAEAVDGNARDGRARRRHAARRGDPALDDALERADDQRRRACLCGRDDVAERAGRAHAGERGGRPVDRPAHRIGRRGRTGRRIRGRQRRRLRGTGSPDARPRHAERPLVQPAMVSVRPGGRHQHAARMDAHQGRADRRHGGARHRLPAAPRSRREPAAGLQLHLERQHQQQRPGAQQRRDGPGRLGHAAGTRRRDRPVLPLRERTEQTAAGTARA